MMPRPKRANVLEIRSRWAREFAKDGKVQVEKEKLDPEEAFFYTLDLLMEDFGKHHRAAQCVLCNPMQVMGLHREEVMIRLLVTLFETFFPLWEEYVLEIKESVLQGLLDRRNRKGYGSWKEKLLDLVNQQVEADLGDFLRDIEKHLGKFSQVELEPMIHDRIFAKAFQILQERWVRRPS
jgi:hypothetical protein